MSSNEYTETDFRIYIRRQAAELKQLLGRMTAAAETISDFQDDPLVEELSGRMLDQAAELKRMVGRLSSDLHIHAKGEHLPKHRERLALKVSRLRRRLERESKRKT